MTIRLRTDLMELVREEMLKQRPVPEKSAMIEVLIEDAMIGRGYGKQMAWLHQK